jgi:hypothetical protein
MNESHKPDRRWERSKKPYTTPHLVEYGPVEKLTHTGSGILGDMDAMMMLVPCL